MEQDSSESIPSEELEEDLNEKLDTTEKKMKIIVAEDKLINM